MVTEPLANIKLNHRGEGGYKPKIYPPHFWDLLKRLEEKSKMQSSPGTCVWKTHFQCVDNPYAGALLVPEFTKTYAAQLHNSIQEWLLKKNFGPQKEEEELEYVQSVNVVMKKMDESSMHGAMHGLLLCPPPPPPPQGPVL